ncbi:S ribonuclease [Pyrus ussuriensis x Pyrus communis]|uniref:S ribonuclease n=1 Tax=Pyrus ussuriensis x Pyrus communis TaxID=2448454 RepID=A0A5N5GX30_9ROSA|nr:S ribonuclease [Pyrus ussuriensis x Pyrus communis]
MGPGPSRQGCLRCWKVAWAWAGGCLAAPCSPCTCYHEASPLPTATVVPVAAMVVVLFDGKVAHLAIVLSLVDRRGSNKGGKKPLIPNGFSELEINEVKLLLQLNGSSASAEYSDCDTNNGGDECDDVSRAAACRDIDDDKREKGVSWWKYKMLIAEGDEEEEDEVSFRPRKKRFRSILELYESTEK